MPDPRPKYPPRRPLRATEPLNGPRGIHGARPARMFFGGDCSSGCYPSEGRKLGPRSSRSSFFLSPGRNSGGSGVTLPTSSPDSDGNQTRPVSIFLSPPDGWPLPLAASRSPYKPILPSGGVALLEA